jgi:hypothetical protein
MVGGKPNNLGGVDSGKEIITGTEIKKIIILNINRLLG